MQAMTPDEIAAFLGAGTRTAKVATVRADGRPHVAPVWFLPDGDQLIFMTWHTTVKAANIRRDGRVAVTVDDEAPPFAYVVVEGVASLSDDAAEIRTWAERIAARYVGPDQAATYGERNGVAGELVVRVSPTRTVAHKGIAD